LKQTSDLAWCHELLPGVSRTYAAAIAVLGRDLRDPVTIAYLWCRAADALEDSWAGTSEQIAERFERFLAALDGDARAADRLAAEARPLGAESADLALVGGLPIVLRAHAALPAGDRDALRDGVRVLASGMARYAVRAAERARPGTLVPYLDTETELHDYCWVVAGCVGVMLTRLFTLRSPARDEDEDAERLRLAPRVGEGLQLTNVLLDWPRDVRRGRCYVPAAWLDEYRVRVEDLADPSRLGAAAAARRLEALARAALGVVPEYLDRLPARQWRYRMFCLWPALWALGSLQHARRDPAFPLGPERPRLPRSRVRALALRGLVWGHGPAGVRRLFAQAG